MIVADTNVWARAYLNDDPVQSHQARAAIKAECARGGILVPAIVLAELFWVLRSQWDKQMSLNALEHLLKTDGVVIESPSVVALCLKEAQAGTVGFADLLIVHLSITSGATEVLTFDKVFARHPHVRRLV